MSSAEVVHWVLTALIFAAYELEHCRNNRLTRGVFELLAVERGYTATPYGIKPIEEVKP